MAVSDAIEREVEKFYYKEARLLDEWKFHEWLDLFTEDVHYWMPVRTTRYTKESKAIAVLDRAHQRTDELAREGDFVIFLGAGNITQWAYALPKELLEARAA